MKRLLILALLFCVPSFAQQSGVCPSGTAPSNTIPYFWTQTGTTQTIRACQDLNTGATIWVGARAMDNSNGIAVQNVETPGGVNVVAIRGGGTLTANTQYCYRVSSTTVLGQSLAATEKCVTTPNVAPNNYSVTVTWAQSGGATGYKVYARTTGAELLAATITNGKTTTWTDNGSVVPAGALPGANTTVCKGIWDVDASVCLPPLPSGGNVTCSMLPALTGAVTSTAGSCATSTRVVCMIVIGDDSAATALSNANLTQGRQCYIPFTATAVEIMVSADAGTPNIIVGVNHGGSVSNLLSAALATAGAGGLACSNVGGTIGLDGATTCSATLQNTSIAAGDWIDAVSGTAGGTAKRMSVAVTLTK